MNFYHRIVVRCQMRIKIDEGILIYLRGFWMIFCFTQKAVKLLRLQGYFIKIMVFTKIYIYRQHVDLVIVNKFLRQVTGGISNKGYLPFSFIGCLIMANHIISFLKCYSTGIPDVIK